MNLDRFRIVGRFSGLMDSPGKRNDYTLENRNGAISSEFSTLARSFHWDIVPTSVDLARFRIERILRSTLNLRLENRDPGLILGCPKSFFRFISEIIDAQDFLFYIILWIYV